MGLQPAVNQQTGKLFPSKNKYMLQIGFFILIFLLGSIPFGLLISRYLLKIDIRKQGSGNIGMTNVMRVGGRLPGVLTFVMDFGKGSISILSARNFFSASEMDQETQLIFHTLAGITVVCGHVFSIFLHFKGGKGISTLFGVLAILHLNVCIFAALTWASMFLWKRISSLSGITMLAVLPWLFLLVPWAQEEKPVMSIFILFILLSSLLIYMHRENILRLLKGQEEQLKSNRKL